MGIKSPLKVFSAARQKIVLQMGASDERGEGGGGVGSGYGLHWRFLSRVITFYLCCVLRCGQQISPCLPSVSFIVSHFVFTWEPLSDEYA